MTEPLHPKSWVEAATMLIEDRAAQVVCPNCGSGVLVAEEVPVEQDPTMFALYLRCPVCQRLEIVDRLRRR
jgi:Zn finger protein HypA/HybF involved in hydrogenase expression